MAQERERTPEKQLLNIIESKDSRGKGAPAQKQAIKRRGLSFFSLGAWKGRFAFLRAGAGAGLKGGPALRLDIKAVNRALLLLMLAMMGYLGLSLYTSIKEIGSPPAVKFEMKDASKAAAFSESARLKTVSYYIEKVLTRNIFKMGLRKIEEEEEVIIERPTDVLGDVASHLRLVGISWSDNPDAMIEDTNTMRTFFVKRGHMIGDLKVHAIFKDKVILMYKGTEIELK